MLIMCQFTHFLQYATNLDVNSGNVIGMGASLSSAIKGVRTTAAAFFHDKPDNLTVRTKVYVNKVIMEGRKAIGVETADGEKSTCVRPASFETTC